MTITEESTAKIADKEEHQAVRNPELVEEEKKEEEEEFNHEDDQDTDLNDSFDLLATTLSLVGSGDEGNNNEEEEEEEEEKEGDEHQTTIPEEIVQVENEKSSEDAETSSADYFIEADEDRLDFDLDDNPEETADNEEQKPNTSFDSAKQIPKTDPKCQEKNVEVQSAEPSNPLIKEPEIDNAVPSSDDDPAANEKSPASKIQIETVQTTKESHETIATTEVPQENIKSSRRTPKIGNVQL